MTRVFGITGWKNSGKTTLVAKLVEEFSQRGQRVSTVKHASANFDLDQPGTDSQAHRSHGAQEVAIVSQKRWAIMHELPDKLMEPTLDDMLAKLSPCDLVLVEGFKTSPLPKIECIRHDTIRSEAIWKTNPAIVAVASDGPLPDCQLQIFSLNDISKIADYIEQFEVQT